jgi:hypothetical protein
MGRNLGFNLAEAKRNLVEMEHVEMELLAFVAGPTEVTSPSPTW